MPIYEYGCRDCGNQFELLVRGDESAVCPSCESKQVAKQFSVPASARSAAGSLPVAVPPGGG